MSSLFTTISFVTAGLMLLVLIYGATRLPPGRLKYIFALFMIAKIIWALSLFAVQIVPLQDALLVSRTIFVAGIVSIFLGGIFLLEFSGRLNDRLRSIVFWVFAGLLISNIILIPWINSAVLVNENGLRSPNRGPGSLFHAASWLSWFMYTIFVLISAYREEQSPLYKFQMRYLARISLICFVIMFGMIAIVSRLHGNVPSAFFAILGSLFLYAGLIRLIAGGRTLYLRKPFARLLENRIFDNSENLTALERLFLAIDRGFGREKLAMSVPFYGAEGGEFRIQLSRGIDLFYKSKKENIATEYVSFAGLASSLQHQSRDNARLRLALEKYEAVIEAFEKVQVVENEINQDLLNTIKSLKEAGLENFYKVQDQGQINLLKLLMLNPVLMNEIELGNYIKSLEEL